MKTTISIVVVTAMTVGAVACGDDGSDVAIPLPGNDSGSDVQVIGQDGGNQEPDAADASVVPVDAAYGLPSNTYPAYTPWMGQLTDNGGPKLTKPVVVTITWDSDTSRSLFEAFGDGIGASNYWSAAVGEYGIGPVTSGAPNHAHVSTPPPAQMNDQQIQNFIASNLGGILPAYTDQTLYVVYLSKSTNLIYGNQSACQAGIGGYHSDFMSNGNDVAYAVLPRCGSDNSVTQASSHEIGEAATDAHPQSKPAIRSFDDPYYAFETWQRFNDENGDACEFFPDSRYTEQQPFAYGVQRLWSNKQGPLGHSPCQPYTVPYYNMAPLDLQDITIDLSQSGGPANFKTKGYPAKLGDTFKIAMGFYSDAPTAPWTVTVAESNPVVNPVSGRLAVSVDPNKTSGVNGEKTFITVTVKQVPQQKIELFTVISTLNGVNHYLPLLVGN
jgi:hypothetical protein